jgi:hypothetical protein
MTIDFARIRTHHGSQQDGFEELCCQLAGCERPEGAISFVRNAPPDAGVECYWVLANGEEHAWQAKYFDAVDDAQWRQLDDSVETALAKHPRLVRYVVCLPIDLPDARIKGRRSLRARWEEQVARWTEQAAARGMLVSFELWGEHELAARLVEPAQAGRRLYWFGGPVFSPDWFVERIREAVCYAGARYTPELHVDLPLFHAFEGLGYIPALCAALRDRLGRVRQRWREAVPQLQRPDVAAALGASLPELQARYAAAVAAIERYGDLDDYPPVRETLRLLQDVTDAALACDHALYRAGRSGPGGTPPARSRPRFDGEAHSLRALAGALEGLAAYCAEPEFQLVSRPALLLAGPGGYGKTHALCDLADRRIAAGQPTVLLLGQQFDGVDPWQAMIGRLGLACTRDELLGALQAAAEAAGSRALLLLDAINEAPGIRWRDELPAMLEVLRRYPRVGFAVSCRDVVEGDLIREDVARSALVRVEHTGLLGRLDQAIERFGRAYGVTELHVPVLSAEFASPLFLKLFFRTRRMHPGAEAPVFNGLADLFETIVRDLDERLSKRDQLNYHPSERRVQRAVERLATLMLDAGRRSLPVEQALEEVRQIHPATNFSASLLGRLLDEGILAEDMGRIEGQDERVVRFAYERHGEHCVAQVLLSRIRAERAAPGAESPTLRWLLRDEEAVARRGRQGLIVATCGLAPALLGQELFEAAPWARRWPGFARLYLASLAIRSPASVGAAGVVFVEGLLTGGAGVEPAEVFTALLEVAVVPRHPLNARWLHGYLRSLPMPERDAVWSAFLHRQWARGGLIARLIDWAWPEDCEVRDPAAHVGPETVGLAALCLGWCLTTPNRLLRDRATKALVSLLQRRLEEAVALVEALGRVDDPYVVERVFAVAYGCALRSEDHDGIAAVARTVFDTAFTSEPPTDVLTRDYARGCVERSLSIGCLLEGDLDVRRIRPPYGSACLTPPPAWDALHAAYPEDGFRVLFSALKGHMSDFTRYVLERPGIGGEDGWTDDPTPLPPMEPLSYTDEEFAEIQRMLKMLGEQIEVGGPSAGSGEDDAFPGDEETTGAGSTPPGDGTTDAPPLPAAGSELEEEGPPDVGNEPGEDRVGPDYASRWILRRVIELGWTPQRFGAFDREVSRHDTDRSGDKPERMSKKYQWIALREFMARLLDRCPYRHRNQQSERYEGVWQLGLRDLDPSLLARGLPDARSAARPSTWWVPVPDPVAAGAELDDGAWLGLLAPLPDPLLLATVREPGSGRDWSVLSLAATWEEPPDAMEARRGGRKRRVSFALGTWLMPRGGADALLASLRDWNFASVDFGEFDLYGYLLGEYFWAASFAPFRLDAAWNFQGEPGRENTQVFAPARGTLPVAATSHQYVAEGGGYDCSLTESVRGHLPSVWLTERLGLRWARRHFRCVAEDGHLLSFDPAAEVGGPRALLVCREALACFLREQGLTLVTAVVGEKNVWKAHGMEFDDDAWPGRLVFRRLLRDDGEGPSLVRARSLLLRRSAPEEEILEEEG